MSTQVLLNNFKCIQSLEEVDEDEIILLESEPASPVDEALAIPKFTSNIEDVNQSFDSLDVLKAMYADAEEAATQEFSLVSSSGLKPQQVVTIGTKPQFRRTIIEPVAQPSLGIAAPPMQHQQCNAPNNTINMSKESHPASLVPIFMHQNAPQEARADTTSAAVLFHHDIFRQTISSTHAYQGHPDQAFPAEACIKEEPPQSPPALANEPMQVDSVGADDDDVIIIEEDIVEEVPFSAAPEVLEPTLSAEELREQEFINDLLLAAVEVSEIVASRRTSCEEVVAELEHHLAYSEYDQTNSTNQQICRLADIELQFLETSKYVQACIDEWNASCILSHQIHHHRAASTEHLDALDEQINSWFKLLREHKASEENSFSDKPHTQEDLSFDTSYDGDHTYDSHSLDQGSLHQDTGFREPDPLRFFWVGNLPRENTKETIQNLLRHVKSSFIKILPVKGQDKVAAFVNFHSIDDMERGRKLLLDSPLGLIVNRPTKKRNRSRKR